MYRAAQSYDGQFGGWAKPTGSSARGTTAPACTVRKPAQAATAVTAPSTRRPAPHGRGAASSTASANWSGTSVSPRIRP